jgi:hypothetical protein
MLDKRIDRNKSNDTLAPLKRARSFHHNDPISSVRRAKAQMS